MTKAEFKESFHAEYAKELRKLSEKMNELQSSENSHQAVIDALMVQYDSCCRLIEKSIEAVIQSPDD